MAAAELSRCMLQLWSSNHSAKFQIDRAPLATSNSLSRTCASLIMGSPAPVRRVDDWTLRCLFNRASIETRAARNELRYEIVLKPRTPSRDFPYPFSELRYYFDPATGDEVARTHAFLMADGITVGASGSRDPKSLYLGGVHYRQMKGSDEIAKDPSKRYPLYQPALGWVVCPSLAS